MNAFIKNNKSIGAIKKPGMKRCKRIHKICKRD